MFAKIIIIYKTRDLSLTNCRKLMMNCRFFPTNEGRKLDNKFKIPIFDADSYTK